MSLSHSYLFTVQPSAIDANGHVSNVAFVQWMQDAAVAHSTAVGAVSLTAAHHGLWVVRSHHIEYKRQTFLGDRIEVRTWIADCRLVSSRRRYEFRRVSPERVEDAGLKDEDGGALLAKGETDWVLIDATTHKPKAIPADLQALYSPSANP